jgi:hypothetical protein
MSQQPGPTEPPRPSEARRPAWPSAPLHAPDPSRPALLGLEPPRRLPAADPAAVLPEEFLLDSRRDLLRRMVRCSWLPALVLWMLWLLLVTLYVLGTSPTYWALTLLISLGDTSYLRQAMLLMGFSRGGLVLAFTALPLLAAALSLVLLSLSARAVGRLRPREMLSEEAFQRAVAERTVLPVIAPAYVVMGLLVIAVIAQAPLQWRSLSAGALSVLALGIGATMIAARVLRRWYSAPRLLGLPSPAALETDALIGPREQRPRAALRLLAQDRRHLPPTSEELGPDAALRALRATARAWTGWVVPAGLGLAWIVFGIADMVVLFTRLGSTNPWQQVPPAELPWQLLVVAVPLGGILVVAMGLCPLVAMRLSRPLRGQVTDQRTYRAWNDRVRVNPWEGAVAARTGWLQAGATLLAVLVLGLVLGLAGALTGVGWVWLVLDVLVLVPLIGLAGAWAMRHHLRYVVYGPAGAYTRRAAPVAMVAPLVGTRADRESDPVVLAEIRRRRRAEAAAAPYDLLAHSAEPDPGAQGSASESEGTSAGAARAPQSDDPFALPDFGAEDGSAARSSRSEPRGHGIPTSTTDLREP